MADKGAYYFAYGSNLLFARLHARTPSITNVGLAVLQEHRLSFNKPGGDGSGKCGIEQLTGEHVLGVVYHMHRSEKPVLDEIEGVGHGYAVYDVEVEIEGAILPVFTYRPTRLDQALQPFDWYKGFVLAGALQNRFPEPYRREIESVRSVRDPDNARRSMNLEIIGDMTPHIAHHLEPENPD